MNIFLEELSKKSTLEIKKCLDGDIIKINDLVKYSRNRIGKLLFRRKEQCVVLGEDYFPRFMTFSDVTKFKFDDYKLLIDKKYIEYGHLNTSEKLIVYLTKQLKFIPEENLEIFQVSTKQIKITIHYPELIITNSTGMSHIMRDLYVTFNFAYNSSHMHWQLARTPVLRRTTYTCGEIKAGYVFSHCIGRESNSSLFSEIGSFCFGSGVLGKIINNYQIKIIPTEIVPFIIAFESYLKWESLEGSPYRRIDNIKEYEVVELKPANSDLLYELELEVLNKLEHFNYDFISENNDIKIILNNSSLNNIRQIIYDYVVNRKYNYLLGRSVNGMFGELKKTDNTRYKNLNNMEIFVFKDKIIKSKVVDVSEDMNELNKKIPLDINPRIVSAVVDSLIKKFKQELIKNKVLI